MPKTANQAKQIKDLRAERLKLIAEARKIQDGAEKESRAMRADEKGSWEETMKKVDELHERVGALERMADAEDDDEDRDDEDTEDEDRDDEDEDEDEDEDRDDEDDEDDDDDDERSGKRKYIILKGKRYRLDKVTAKRRTQPGLPPNKRAAGETEQEYRTRQRRSTPEYRQVFNQYLVDGYKVLGSRLAQRAIQADSDIVGGYLVAPQEFVAKLIKFMNNYLFIRQKATKYVVKAAQSLGAPSLDNDISDADWTSELDTATKTTRCRLVSGS